MQEEVENKTVALAINTTKLTVRELRAAILKYLESQKNKNKSRDSPEIPHGKQSVKSLAKQNQGMTSIEITDQNIKSFEQVARKYGVDNETSEVAYTDNQWSEYLNLCKEYRQDKSAPTIKTSFQEGKICREKKEHSHHR